MSDRAKKALTDNFFRQIIRSIYYLLPHSLRRWIPEYVIRQAIEDARSSRNKEDQEPPRS